MGNPDLSPIWTISMDDIEELQEEAIATGWDIRYTQYEAGKLNGTLTELSLPGLLVAREIYGRGFFASASLPKDFTPVFIPLRSKDDVRLNGRPFAPGDIFIPGDVSEIDFGGPRGIDLITLHLEPESRRNLAALLGQREFDDILSRAMLHHRGPPQQRAAFEASLAALTHEKMWPPPANANLMAALRDKALEDFAALLVDAESPGLPTHRGRPSNGAHYARQARAHLDANQDRAVSRAELCRVTRTSARTMNTAFQDRYGVTPQVYHRTRRLSAVHRILKRHWPNEVTVTDVAFGHGFWHLGRFSQAYKHRFGESPSETLARRPPVLGVSRMASRGQHT